MTVQSMRPELNLANYQVKKSVGFNDLESYRCVFRVPNSVGNFVSQSAQVFVKPLSLDSLDCKKRAILLELRQIRTVLSNLAAMIPVVDQ